MLIKNHRQMLMRWTRIITALSFSASFSITSFPTTLQAQTLDELLGMPISELMMLNVVTASRYPQTQNTASGIVTVLTHEEMKLYGAIQLRDVLDRLPDLLVGFDEVNQHRRILVRGDNGSDERVLTLINGRPFRSANSGFFSNIYILSTMPVDTIERIEYVRGPGSVLYGSNAMSAVLNIITRKAKGDGGSASLSGGDFSTRRAYVSAERVSTDWNAVINIQHHKENGWPADFFLPDQEAAGGIRPVQMRFAQEHDSLSGNINWHQLTLDFHVADSDLDGDRQGLIESTFRQNFVALTYQADWFEDWQQEVHLSRQADRNLIDDSIIDGETWLFESFASRSLEAMNFVLGGTVEHLSFDIHDAFGEVVGHPATRYGDSNNRYSFFGQMDIQLSDPWRATIGGQTNKLSDQVAKFVPRLGVIYSLQSDWTMKLLYSEAYRAPNLLERGLQTTFLIGDKKLKPETVATWDWQWSYQQDRYYWSATVFRSHYKQQIQQTPFVVTGGQVVNGQLFLDVIPGEHRNQRNLKVYGLEWEGKWQLLEQLMLDGSWSWQRNEDGDGSEDTTTFPRWMAKWGMRYQPHSGWTLGAFHSHIDEFRDATEVRAGIDLINPVPQSYDLLSLNLLLDCAMLFHRGELVGLTAGLYGQNLLDDDVVHSMVGIGSNNAIPAHPGRSWTLKLAYQW